MVAAGEGGAQNSAPDRPRARPAPCARFPQPTMMNATTNLLMPVLAPLVTVAQTGATKGSPTGYFISIGVLLATLVAGTVLLLWVRRRSMSSMADQDHAPGFMDSLRAMHRDGKLSDAEFAAAKAKLSGRLRASMDRPRTKAKG